MVLVVLTVVVAMGVLGTRRGRYQDVERHLDADPLAPIDSVGPADGGRAAFGETEIQG